MNLKCLWLNWCKFWFISGSPIPIALFRICLGILVLCFYWWISPESATFFGSHAIVRAATTAQWLQYPEFDLLSLFPADDFYLHAMLLVLVVCAVCLTVGLFSRPSALLLYLIILSLDSRNHFVLNSGIRIMAIFCLFIVFSRCGEALSFKRLLKIWRKNNPEFGAARSGSVLIQRLIQVQLVLIYWSASCWKLNGASWIEGTAVYYTTSLLQFQRFSLPYIVDHLWTSRFLAWGSLVFETLFPYLVWFKEFRYPLLVIGVFFHLGMDWVLVIPIFQEVMLASYLCFIDAGDLGRIMETIKRVMQSRVSRLVPVVYDPNNPVSSRLAETVKRLDIFGLLEFRQSAHEQSDITVNDGIGGVEALRCLALRLPLLLPLAPMFWVPGMGRLATACGAAINRAYGSASR